MSNQKKLYRDGGDHTKTNWLTALFNSPFDDHMLMNSWLRTRDVRQRMRWTNVLTGVTVEPDTSQSHPVLR